MSDIFARLFENGSSIQLEGEEYLFFAGDPVKFMYLLLEGQVDLLRHTANGSVMIMNRVFEGCIAAEASAYSDVYHCDAKAKSRSKLQIISVDMFLERLERTEELRREWAAHLARELQKSRLQAEVRALKTVAQRLDAWIGANGDLPPRGSWQDIAQIIGVSREALYRELARRRVGID
ncbi:Crp/Fnr family transcriptional regulator [uncultured Roseibium sp.]|uniref:Crp/Fnr family transcriptional regulator n=1 Tax=uncultured Roseibium sp. TaxID=1936171 RepID=UPI0026393848|nr:Crp/Fnr family transcriptional regulator [uncultured Roseibium sp.]